MTSTDDFGPVKAHGYDENLPMWGKFITVIKCMHLFDEKSLMI